MIYKLTYIKGIRRFVKDELYLLFSNRFKIVKETDSELLLDTDILDIDEFRILHTVLHVSLIEDNQVTVQRNLYKKGWRKHLVPAGINPTLAFVLCKLAQLNKDDILMDPFCGGGTIPITAILEFNIKKALASDISSKAIEYTKKNLIEAGITKDRYSIFISDLQRLRIQKEYLTKIVTNMPFGIREGKHKSNLNLYKSFIRVCYSALKKDGILVAFTTEKSLILEHINDKFELIEELKVSQGGLYPSAFVLRKV